MKKQTKPKKIPPLERIASALEDIAKSLALSALYNELHKAIDEHNERQEYFKITERPDLKTSEIMDIMRSKFKVWSYYDDIRLDKDFPAPKEATTRYFKKTVEPDEDLLGKSAKECEEMGIPGITLRERLLMEIQYFDETGNHLDIKGITICSGSRYSDGCVPRVSFVSGGEVYVCWYLLGSSGGECGVRRAVTL